MDTKISLRAARVNANLTIAQSAKLIGVDPSTLMRWERHPNMVQQKYLDRISKIYKYPTDNIFFGNPTSLTSVVK